MYSDSLEFHLFRQGPMSTARAVVHCLGAWAAMDVALISAWDAVDEVDGMGSWFHVGSLYPHENHRKTIGKW